VILIVFGGWLVFEPRERMIGSVSLFKLIPFIVLVFIFLQSVPLPFDLVSLLSPARAERIEMVNKLAGTSLEFISLSDRGVDGFRQGIFFASLLLYYYCLRRLFIQDNRMIFVLGFCLVAVGSLEALYGLMQFVNPGIGILWLKISGRAAHGTIIYKNQYASLLNMIWPLAVAFGSLYFINRGQFRKKRVTNKKSKSRDKEYTPTKIWALSFIFVGGMMVLAVLFSLSRGGILSMLLIATIFTILLPFAFRSKLIFMGVFVVLVAGYGSILGLDTLLSRFNSVGGSGSQRIDIYLSSLPMLWDHWLTGIGIESYAFLSPIYLKGFPENLLYDSVHNEYLELLIELGIPMAMLVFIWLAAGGVKIVRAFLSVSYTNLSMDGTTIIGIAAFCGLVGFLAHGLIDFGWRLPVNMLYGVTLFAMLCHSLDWVKREQSVSDNVGKVMA
jgi:O-antigen ligase